jgi:hypothetical protein
MQGPEFKPQYHQKNNDNQKLTCLGPLGFQIFRLGMLDLYCENLENVGKCSEDLWLSGCLLKQSDRGFPPKPRLKIANGSLRELPNSLAKIGPRQKRKEIQAVITNPQPIVQK